MYKYITALVFYKINVPFVYTLIPFHASTTGASANRNERRDCCCILIGSHR